MTYFITGGTGFLGSSIILDLLTQTTDKIFCLVRASNGKSASDRIFDKLSELIEAYKYDTILLQNAKKQCIVVNGELGSDIEIILHQVNCDIDQFIHSAASLNHEERFREKIFQTNLNGTKWALELSKKLRSTNFNYVSTAYIVGNRAGVMYEKLVEEDRCNNVYESSKLATEKIVIESGHNYRIFRPGIIIGHSKTRYTFNYTGLYGFIKKLVQFKGVMNRIQKGYLEKYPIRMLAEGEVKINFIPVDMVSNHLTKVLLGRSNYKIYHLTNQNALNMNMICKNVFEKVGLKKPVFELNDTNFNWIDKKFNEKMDFYRPQFFGNKTFDRTCINNAINQNTFEDYDVTEKKLQEYIDWYILYLNKERKTIPVTR